VALRTRPYAEPPTNPLAVDGTIQRFEFTIKLFWKVMKRLLAREGLDARTPRETLNGVFPSRCKASSSFRSSRPCSTLARINEPLCSRKPPRDAGLIVEAAEGS
jgi:nucleotidyltransferase-like protein